MAYSATFESRDALSLEEFVDAVRRSVDVTDPFSLREAGPILHALSLNRRLFDDVIADAVKANASSGGLQQSFNAYTDATFLLGGCPDQSFFVRANVWRKPKVVAGSLKMQNELYSYDAAHDHNFDFLTVGYFGSGYTTRIFEYDSESLTGEIGKPVEIQFLEETNLPVGKVMMYRKSTDIHCQKPPSETSISLNLMAPVPFEGFKEQYFFDLEKSSVGGFVPGPAAYQVSLLSLAGDLGDGNMIEPLLSIATKGICSRTRASAIEALLNIDPGLHEFVAERCSKDFSVLVSKALTL